MLENKRRKMDSKGEREDPFQITLPDGTQRIRLMDKHIDVVKETLDKQLNDQLQMVDEKLAKEREAQFKKNQIKNE
jgi:hypothetical protein